MDLLDALMLQYPILTKIFLVIGLFRILFKPLMSAIQQRVELTVDTEDDAKFRKFMESKWYVILSFLFDLSTSIKLPKVDKKE